MSTGSEIGTEINRKDHGVRSVHTHESILDQFLTPQDERMILIKFKILSRLIVLSVSYSLNPV